MLQNSLEDDGVENLAAERKMFRHSDDVNSGCGGNVKVQHVLPVVRGTSTYVQDVVVSREGVDKAIRKWSLLFWAMHERRTDEWSRPIRQIVKDGGQMPENAKVFLTGPLSRAFANEHDRNPSP
jgi:hypothetical protein